MAVEVSVHPKDVTFNSVTWDAANGGPTTFRFTNEGNPLETRVANNLYPICSKIVDASGTAAISLTEFNPSDEPAIGTKSTIVFTLELCDGTESEKTMYNMIYRGSSGNQDRASAATVDLNFVFQSDDGTNGPFDNPA